MGSCSTETSTLPGYLRLWVQKDLKDYSDARRDEESLGKGVGKRMIQPNKNLVNKIKGQVTITRNLPLFVEMTRLSGKFSGIQTAPVD